MTSLVLSPRSSLVCTLCPQTRSLLRLNSLALSASPFLSCRPAVCLGATPSTQPSLQCPTDTPKLFLRCFHSPWPTRSKAYSPAPCCLCCFLNTDESTKTVVSFGFPPLTPFHYTILAIHKEMTCLGYVYWYISVMPACRKHVFHMYLLCMDVHIHMYRHMYLLCMYVRIHMYRHGMCVEARQQFMGFGFHSPPSELQGSQVLRFVPLPTGPLGQLRSWL